MNSLSQAPNRDGPHCLEDAQIGVRVPQDRSYSIRSWRVPRQDPGERYRIVPVFPAACAARSASEGNPLEQPFSLSPPTKLAGTLVATRLGVSRPDESPDATF